MHKRLIVFALLFCFFVVPPLEAAFISIHADHYCIVEHGEHCPVCVTIHHAGNLLKQIRDAASIIFFAAAGLFAVTISRIKLRLFGNYLTTLVDVKARMNN